MLQAISHHFEADKPSYLYSTRQYLKKSDLRDFLSVLFDTTIARSSSGHHEQLLDVFYGTLMVCMIRTVLFMAFRYSKYDYKPFHFQADPDPTFLDGTKCQVYQPMLLLLESSLSTCQEGNAHFRRAATAVHTITFGSSSTTPPDSVFMYIHALCFIDHFSREGLVPQYDRSQR